VRREFQITLALTGMLWLSGCAVMHRAGAPAAKTPANRAATSTPAPGPSPSAHEKDPVYWVLVGEMAAQRDDADLAVRAYLKASRLSSDPAVARRAVGIALSEGSDQDALEAAERWAALAPDEDEALRVLGVMYLRTGHQDKARRTIARAIEKDSGGVGNGFLDIRPLLLGEVADEPKVLDIIDGLRQKHAKVPEAQYTYASLALAAGKVDAALTAVKKALKLAPGWAEAQSLYAHALLQHGDTDKALDVMLDAVHENPDDQSLRVSYGKMLLQAGRTGEAKQAFRRLLKRHPHSADALYALGLISMQQGKYKESRHYFMRTLQVPGHRQAALYQLGELARRQGKDREALQWFMQVQGGAHVYRAQIGIARTLADMGRMQAARDHLDQLRKQNPELAVQLYLVEGELLISHRHYQQAYQLYGKALSAHPHDPDLLYARALAADHVDKIDQAEQDLREILKQHPEDAAALNALGYTLANRTQRYQEAYKYISKAYKLSPDNPAVIDSMGWVYFRMGDYKKAEKYLRRAHKLTPDPEVAAHLGQLLWVTGRKTQARKVWQDAHRANPDNKALNRTLERFLK